jgi:hypothetical protein
MKTLQKKIVYRSRYNLDCNNLLEARGLNASRDGHSLALIGIPFELGWHKSPSVP